MAAAAERQNATRAKDAGWPVLFKLGHVRSQSGWVTFQMPDQAIDFAILWKGRLT